MGDAFGCLPLINDSKICIWFIRNSERSKVAI